MPSKYQGDGPKRREILWYCEPCWLGWRTASKQWFVEEATEKWTNPFGEGDAAGDESPLLAPREAPPSEETFYDFVEIGTSSYHTFTQAVVEHPDGKPMAWNFLPWWKHPLRIRGLAVDMQSRYLEQLPDLPRVKKVHAAISARGRAQRMYHVKLGDVERWESIFAANGRWHNFRIIRLARGCSALRSHASLRRALRTVGLQHLGCVKRVRTLSMGSLLKRLRAKGIGILALDCEGHDCSILRGLMRTSKDNPHLLPEWIWFESNGMNDEISGKGMERRTVQDLQNLGYEVWWGGGYRDSGKRDTVLRLRASGDGS